MTDKDDSGSERPAASWASWAPGQPLIRKKAKRRDDDNLTRADLRIGGTYTRRQIHSALGGPVQEYLPHVEGRVVCACLTLALNPEAPNVVLPASGPMIQHWALVFARQAEAVPVFLRHDRTTAQWEYVGDYRVTRVERDPARIAHHARIARRSDVPFVLYLERAA